MRRFKKGLSALSLSLFALALTAPGAMAALDTSTITLDSAPAETFAPKVIGFVVTLVIIGAIIKLTRKGG